MPKRAKNLLGQSERRTWRQAALRIGEELATVGPKGYYDFTAKKWLAWAIDLLCRDPTQRGSQNDA